MESRTKLLGHPIHQMLVVFPLGLLAMAVIFDLLAIGLGEGYWSEIAYWMMAAGIITGMLAAPFGDRLAVGVDEGAHVDAPSSLTNRRVRA